MTPDRHRQATELFLRVRQVGALDRPAALRAQCGDDPEMIAMVEGLLEHDSTDSETEPGQDPAEPDHAARLVGKDLGRYRLQAHINTGGMGAVYEAVDHALGRRVAVKVLHSLGSAAAIRRFSKEPLILAGLHHPGIAHVYENGAFRDDEGRLTPFYAMELIPGARTILDFAASGMMSLRGKLSLLGRVCDAVHHAHQRGVVHRDLKPDNILVDESGQPKVIDFGVAAVTNADIAVTSMETRVGQLIGTVRYMSPEQCDGSSRETGVRSDVYALGLVAYEVLCGRSPYSTEGCSLPAAIRVIQTQPPARPTTPAGPLPRDLEAVLLMALRKQPEQRYQSAAELADDLQRCLAGRRTRARQPGPLTTAFDRLVEHPRLTTAAVCVLVVAVAIASLWLGAYVSARRPDNLTLDARNRSAILRSMSGAVLRRWDSGADGGLLSADIIDRSPALGGGRLAVIGYFHTATSGFPGEVAVYDLANSAEPLWHTGQRPLRLPEGEKGHIEARMAGQRVLIADVLPSSPGDEIVVVHQLLPGFAASTIRVFDAAGTCMFRVWNDGAIDGLRWIEADSTLCFVGYNSERMWVHRGVRTQRGSNRYPTIIAGLRIDDRHADSDRWVAHDGALDPDLDIWYRWLGPVDSIHRVDEVRSQIRAAGGAFNDGHHIKVECQIWDDPSPGLLGFLAFTFDATGREVSRYSDDAYKSQVKLGRFSPEDSYTWLPYGELPRPN